MPHSSSSSDGSSDDERAHKRARKEKKELEKKEKKERKKAKKENKSSKRSDSRRTSRSRSRSRSEDYSRRCRRSRSPQRSRSAERSTHRRGRSRSGDARPIKNGIEMRGRGHSSYGNRDGYGGGGYSDGYGGSNYGNRGNENGGKGDLRGLLSSRGSDMRRAEVYSYGEGSRGNENTGGKGDLRGLLSSRGGDMRRAEVASNGVGKCAGEVGGSVAPPYVPKDSVSGQSALQSGPSVDDDDEEPFVTKYTASSAVWQRLQAAKSRLLAAPESVWKARALPKTGFTDQFRGCLAELDHATGERLSLGASGRRTDGGGGGATFLDLGCAPGGFSLHLLGKGLRGVGATLAPKPGFHAMDRRLDTASAGYELVTISTKDDATSNTDSGGGGGEDGTTRGSAHNMDEDNSNNSSNNSNTKQASVKVYPASSTGAWTLHYADINDDPGGTKFLAPTTSTTSGSSNAAAASAAVAQAATSPEAHLFDVVIAGARFSKSGKSDDDDEGGGGTRAVARLLTAQLLLALRHLQRGGHLVLVLNVTPLLTYTAPLALLRECFEDLVACKPASCFEHRASCYVAGLGYRGTCQDSTGAALLDPVARLSATLAALDEADRIAEIAAEVSVDAVANGAEEARGESNAGITSSIEDRHLHFPCAPLIDTTGAALWVRHGAAIEQLMTPLWAFQASCIEALLARAPAGGDASGAMQARSARFGGSSSGAPTAAAAAAMERGECAAGCGFLKHPNPPAHFTPADRAYCCAWCRSSRGRSHGEHCLKKKGHQTHNSSSSYATSSSGGKGGKGRQSAPKAFGRNDHGDGLKPHEDLPERNCKRVDDEGMVYVLLDTTSATATTATASSSRRGRGNPDDVDDDQDEEEDQGSAAATVQQQQQQQQQSGGVYFCDRFRRYRFTCNSGGLALLQGLVGANKVLLTANEACFEGRSPRDVAQQRQEGYALYEEKPTLQKGHGGHGGGGGGYSSGSRVNASSPGFVRPLGTWSDAEYALPGFQWMYLRLKSFQRFAETWALLERCAAGGLFLPGAPLHNCCASITSSSSSPSSSSSAVAAAAAAAGSTSLPPVKIVSLGGGPGYELLAADWFFELEAAVPSWTWQPNNDDASPAANAAVLLDGGNNGDGNGAGRWVLRHARELSAARAAWLSSNFPKSIPRNAASKAAKPAVASGAVAEPAAAAAAAASDADLPPPPEQSRPPTADAPPQATFSSLDLQVCAVCPLLVWVSPSSCCK